MTYFHTGIRTIIGAESFHCPVRDGKEWDQLAMVIRLNRWLLAAPLGKQRHSVVGSAVARDAPRAGHKRICRVDIINQLMIALPTIASILSLKTDV